MKSKRVVKINSGADKQWCR